MWSVARISVALTTRRSASACSSSSKEKSSRRDQSAMYGEGENCAWSAPIRSIARGAVSRARSSRSWRASSVRFSSRRVRTRSVIGLGIVGVSPPPRPGRRGLMADAAAEIRELIERRAAAIRARDVDGSLSAYAPDVVAFDLIEPLQYRGSDAVRQRLEQWFSSFDGEIGYENREVGIEAGEEVAFAHSLDHVNGRTTDG